ncbi:CDP-2,3-bis-(O-geranylgeranyl)-sn-glycerol synthase [Oxyplasma meridianum]|uniref:CDP-archaeol synthase n=1 Tax=Oxyplasma meridianum TaxID=3073602 RepID=A0AAX4NJJ4_9ARCH
MPDIPLEIFQSLLFFIPAFIANPGAVITGGHFPIDFGKKFVDGKRIFGDGKTWSGFFGGVASGVIFGLIIYALLVVLNLHIGNFSSTITGAIGVLITMSAGSLLGDMVGSFIKRRIGIERGGKGSLLDQWPFVLMAFLILFIFERQFFMTYYGDIVGLITILVITPPLHRAVNIIGYRMNKKDVPW